MQTLPDCMGTLQMFKKCFFYIYISDLLPVSSGEFLGEGCDGVLELQDAGVSLSQRVPENLKFLRQTSELGFSLIQLALKKQTNQLTWRNHKQKKNRDGQRLFLFHVRCH